jgi:hypothetical protein
MQHQKLIKATVSLVLATIVGLSLWLSSPKGVRALTVSFPSLPSPGTLGQTYTFSARIDINDGDVLPLQSAKLEIINNSNTTILTCDNLPTVNGTKNYSSGETGNGIVSVIASTSGSWPYSSDNRTINWEGSGYSLGYGYGYGLPGGSITYNTTWTIPSSLPTGNYSVKITVYGNNSTHFSKTSATPFNLTQPASGGGGGFGGGGENVPVGPGVTDVTLYTDSQGVFNLDFQAKSENRLAWVSIIKGVKATQTDSFRVKGISIIPMENTPDPNVGNSMFGLAYTFGPEGATFNPSITITLTYDPAKLPEGFDARNLVLATWDTVEKKWVVIEGSIVNTETHTVSAKISHFSSYAIFGTVQPASITVNGLDVSPQQVQIGDTITISAIVVNDGDLAGNYTLILKVNGKQEASQDITLGGNNSKTVKFNISRNQAGIYEIEVNGKTATFMIQAAGSPAKLVLKSLSVSPDKVTFGDDIMFSVIAENVGDEALTQTVTIKIDGNVVNSQEITLAPHGLTTVKFNSSTVAPGSHTVDINGQQTIFTVDSLVAPAPRSSVNWWSIGLIILLSTTLASFIIFRTRSRSQFIPPNSPRMK